MAQIVPGEEAVKFRKLINDQFTLRLAALVDRVIDPANRRWGVAQRLRQRYRHRLGIEDIAAHQHRSQTEHVIRRFTVHQRSLSGRVGVYHPAQRGAVAGGKLRCKEVTIGFKKLVQLIFDDPGFNAHPALFGVNLDDAIHIAGHIDNNPAVQRLAVGAGAAAARREDQRCKARFGGDARQQGHVRRRTREKDRIRQQLIDAVVGGHRQPVGIAGGGIAGKTLLLQYLQKIQHQLNYPWCLRNLWDHHT